MNKLSIEEIKSIQTNILLDVHNFCIKNNIKYSLACGTLIGAVRHKGFIPWDDDIDVMMLREDYDRFVEIYTSSDCKVFSHRICDEYAYPFAKVSDENTILIENTNMKQVLGVNIDIFPIDNIPGDICERSKHFNKIKMLRNILLMKQIKLSATRSVLKNISIVIMKFLLILLPQMCIVRYIDTLARKYMNEQTAYVADIVEGYGLKEVQRKELFDNFIDLDFEGFKFKSVCDFSIYLTCLYGDFMELPPLDKQVTHHSFIAYRK